MDEYSYGATYRTNGMKEMPAQPLTWAPLEALRLLRHSLEGHAP